MEALQVAATEALKVFANAVPGKGGVYELDGCYTARWHTKLQTQTGDTIVFNVIVSPTRVYAQADPEHERAIIPGSKEGPPTVEGAVDAARRLLHHLGIGVGN